MAHSARRVACHFPFGIHVPGGIVMRAEPKDTRGESPRKVVKSTKRLTEERDMENYPGSFLSCWVPNVR